jgi:hypothetical protein
MFFSLVISHRFIDISDIPTKYTSDKNSAHHSRPSGTLNESLKQPLDNNWDLFNYRN